MKPLVFKFVTLTTVQLTWCSSADDWDSGVSRWVWDWCVSRYGWWRADWCGRADWVGHRAAAGAVGDGQSRSFSRSVGLTAVGDLGGLWAVGGVCSDDLGGVDSRCRRDWCSRRRVGWCRRDWRCWRGALTPSSTGVSLRRSPCGGRSTRKGNGSNGGTHVDCVKGLLVLEVVVRVGSCAFW